MAKKPDIKSTPDRGESTALIQPLVISEAAKSRPHLLDLALELTASSSALRASLPNGILSALATLVRSMNCYYSNLIEGHNTHPIDIERALQDDFSKDIQKRNLQLEAKAHVAVQKWIDDGGLKGQAATQAGICEIHKRFSALLPEALLISQDTENKNATKVIPGEYRTRDVKVGQHIPISPGAVPRFMEQFEKTYSALNKSESILSSAAAHHRLLWIHPFLDGNGRVARLMSHASLLDALNTGGIWSIARGLARNVNTYKSHLMECDLKRRNDLDGRGNLSEEALISFTVFFLTTCIDQVNFMSSLLEPNRLRERILFWANETIRNKKLPLKSDRILEAILYRGELPRVDVAKILDMSDRHARRIVSALIEENILKASSTRAPLALAFPAKLAPYWMPGLFPEKN